MVPLDRATTSTIGWLSAAVSHNFKWWCLRARSHLVTDALRRCLL